MATPQAINHALMRPSVLHILRAAGYHSTKPSVLETLTDLSGRYMLLLATATAEHASMNEEELEITIENVRMALQDCGALAPEKTLEDQMFDDEEDTRGVDQFLAWAAGPENKEIRRIALEGGEESKDDYLTVLKKKHDNTEEESRYQGTILGKSAETRIIALEGGDITSVKDWTARLQKNSRRLSTSALSSRRQSSDLSSIGDQEMSGIEFD